MQMDQIKFHLEISVTLKLLNGDYANLAVGFFFHVFKSSGKIQIPENILKMELERYLEQEDVRTNTKKKTTLPQFAQKLLGMWCDDKHRFLLRYYDFESDVPIVELTYDTERPLEWVASLDKREFVGTHSRF